MPDNWGERAGRDKGDLDVDNKVRLVESRAMFHMMFISISSIRRSTYSTPISVQDHRLFIIDSVREKNCDGQSFHSTEFS